MCPSLTQDDENLSLIFHLSKMLIDKEGSLTQEICFAVI
jgi:hypothetical protein